MAWQLAIAFAFVLWSSLAFHLGVQHRLHWAMRLVLLAVSLLAAVAWWASYQFVWKPVDNLVQATTTLRRGNLQTPVPIPTTDGGFGPVASAIQEFAAEVSKHEFERKQSEEELKRLHRTFRVLSAVNQCVIRSTTEQQLLTSVCDAIVKENGYSAAWVGFAQPDGTVQPFAHAGVAAAAYLAAVKITWSDAELGRGPVGMSIRTGQPCVVRVEDPNFKPWRAEARKHGYGSVAAFPLLAGGKAYGALSIYGVGLDSFNADAVSLLSEMAQDLSYGIIALRTQAERDRAERNLRLTQYAIDHSVDAAFWVTPEGRFAYVNETACRMLGYSRTELLQLRVSDIDSVISEKRWLEEWEKRKERQSFVAERDLIAKGGTLVPVELSVNYVNFGNAEFHCAFARDISERAEATKAIRLQTAALESAANAIVLTNADGKILWVNRAFTQLTGYEKEEALGQKLRILKSGHHGSEFYKELWTTIRAGNPWHGEMVNRRKDGRLYTEEMTITPVADSEGNVSHFIAIKQNVTDRKAHEESLALSEQRFRLAFERGPVGILFVGPELRIMRVNQTLCQMLGYTEDQLLAQDLNVITHPEDTSRDIEIAQQIMKGDLPSHRWETRYLSRTGEALTAVVTASLIRGQNGTPLYGMAIIEDHTEQRRMEQELLRRTRELTAIFEALPDLYLRLRTDGTVVDCLSAPDTRLFHNPDKLIGRALPSSLPQEVGTQFDRAMKRLTETSTPVSFDYELTLDGEKRFYAARMSKMGADDVVAVVQDLTERHQLEEQLRQSQKLEAVGRLAGGIAHDFNNMLGVIIGYAQILQDKLSTEETLNRQIGEIKRAADRAAALTRQLLAFSRKQVLRPQTLDLNAVVRDLSKMLRRMIGEDIELIVRAGSPLGFIQADLSQMEQVLMNLAVNARDAMEKGGKLIVETTNVDLDKTYAEQHQPVIPGEYVMLTVTDTGCGMDAKTRARIFEPFFTTKQAGKGTGLGLSTVFGIVKQSGGYIWVYSEPNSGTAFKIYFPRTDKACAVEPGVEKATPALVKATILIVEDEEPLRNLTADLLEQAGFQVIAAKDGPTAVEVARNGRNIDLLLTDVLLPGMSGPEVAGKIHELQPLAKVAYMSGYNDELVAIHGVLKEGLTLIEKPFTRDSLISKVCEALAKTPDVSIN